MADLTHRLFFGLQPDDLQRARIGALRDQFSDASSLVSNSRQHVTLAITNDFPHFPEEIAARMQAIGARVAADPFELCLDRLSGSPSSVALRPSHRSSGLTDLQHQLGTAMMRWNIARDDWAFNPHLTLLYRDGRPFLRPIQPIILQPTEFVLIHSVVGATQHHELGRWRLSVRQQCFLFA